MFTLWPFSLIPRFKFGKGLRPDESRKIDLVVDSEITITRVANKRTYTKLPVISETLLNIDDRIDYMTHTQVDFEQNVIKLQ